MKILLRELTRKGINEETVTPQDVIVKLKENHIKYCEGKFDAITDYVIMFGSNPNNQRRYRIYFQDSKIISIYRLNLDGEDCEPVFDRQYLEMYDLVLNTLYDFANAECEMSYNSFKNTLENMKFKHGAEYSKLEFLVMDYNMGTEVVVKIGMSFSAYWQYAIYFTCSSLYDDAVTVVKIKDFSIDDTYINNILEE